MRKPWFRNGKGPADGGAFGFVRLPVYRLMRTSSSSISSAEVITFAAAE